MKLGIPLEYFKTTCCIAIFHAVSNVYIQKIMPSLTLKIEGSEHWLGENGIMFSLITLVFGLYFWFKGLKKNYNK